MEEAMPTAKTVWLYQFDELDDKAKEKAREWYRGLITGEEISEQVYEDFQEICKILGIELKTRSVPLCNGKSRDEPCIWWSGFSSQGDGASFEGRYRAAKDSVANLKAHAPLDEELQRIAEDLHALQIKYGNHIECGISTNPRYYHKYSMQFEFYDWEVPEDNEAGWKICEIAIEDRKAMSELFRDLAEWLYRRLSDQNDYLNSSEYLDETIRANEYTFLLDGTRED